MSMPSASRRVTVAEYLRLERAAKERHQYLDGEIYAMAGESPEHADISTNVVGSLFVQLKGTPCRVRTKDSKVRSGPVPRLQDSTSGLYSYPDLVVVCGEPEYHDDSNDILLNPTVILEVLSPSTEAFDRGEKFARYQVWNPSLTDYVLISQDRPQIELFSRQADGSWSYRLIEGLESSVVLPTIGCTLNLADVYDRIVF